MPKVTLHVGMPKCATTTIQNFLADRAEWLAMHGQVYEKHPEDQTRNQGNAAPLAAFCGARDLENMEAHLRYFLRSGRDVVLSSEMLFHLARGEGFIPLRDTIGRLGYDLRVVVYLKRQDLWIESDFKQHVKGGSPWVGTFEELLARRLSRGTLDYHRLMSYWAAHVGRTAVTVVPLNPSQAPDYALCRFLEVIGLAPPKDLQNVERQNVSPPAALIEAARYIKAVLSARGHSVEEISPLLEQFIAQAPEQARTPLDHDILSPDSRKTLLESCAASNAALAEDFLSGQAPFEAPKIAPDAWVPLLDRALPVLSEFAARGLLSHSHKTEAGKQAPDASRLTRLIGRWRNW